MHFAGDDLLPIPHQLPPNVIDALVLQLPPLALQKLQTALPFDDGEDDEFADKCIGDGRKRGRSTRHSNFDKAWGNFYKFRWQDTGNKSKVTEPPDWQQKYWETHLQTCLDEAAEIASLPSFKGCLGEIRIPDSIL